MKTHISCATALAAVLLATTVVGNADAQGSPYIGQIKTFGFDYCPRGWVRADGQILSISQETALFSLYSTLYGGDGYSTFAVPNLIQRFALGQGQGPGLSAWSMGDMWGAQQHTLTVSQMPAHRHDFVATTTQATEVNPTGRTVGSFVSAAAYAVAGSSNVPMNSDSIDYAGGSNPIEIQDPYLALNFCVNLDGVYPPRP